ncbi:ATP-binding protein [Anaerotalea alkaliphila]|uniref:histidine kinase n=1 Tax=Anaerotalea alkaliphila TaxID=2662126 RepID=A0A7X5HTU5_9FIRM|nr:substrate-binding domain-containing protein [Anaerotalea alkaliphila]NDL66560.1 substrate-binding domain-containing protein [Anaerotalea alkaliphila]
MSFKVFDNKRPTIGVLMDSLNAFDEYFEQEFAYLCNKMDLNLLLFPEELATRFRSDKKGTNIAFQFLNSNAIDGLVLMNNAISIYEEEEQFRRVFEKYGKHPLVCVGNDLEGVTTVVEDGRSGLRGALRHLIEDHDYREIAIINGEKTHRHAVNRFNTYKEMLEEYGIPYDEKRVVQGDYTVESGRQGVAKLLDENKATFEAIFAANDEMAIGAMEELIRRGYRIPEDMKILGYDDIRPVQFDFSPLSTVSQPVREMAKAALEQVLAQIQGDMSVKKIVLPSHFVKRNTCGCSVEVMVNREHLVHQGIERIIQDQEYKSFMMQSVHEVASAGDTEALRESIVQALPHLGIRNMFLALYDKEAKEVQQWKIPLKSSVFLAYREMERIREVEGREFVTEEIIPRELQLVDGRKTMILGPLYFHEELLGYTFFELGMQYARIYESIRKQIATILKFILLLEDIRQTQERLIESEKMAALANLVAGVAHEINTPIGVSVAAASYLEKQNRDMAAAYEAGKVKKSEFEQFLDNNLETASILMQNLNKAGELVNSFKNISVDQTSEQKRIFQVRSYLDQILLSLKPKLKDRDVDVHIDCDEELAVLGYPGAFSQIITNLVLNSLSHAFREDEEGTIRIQVEKVREKVRLVYSDNGKGIPEEDLDRIFEPFYTTNRSGGGTGLGLNVIYNLVRQKLDGQIRCTSKQGKGCRFEVEWKEQ